MGKHIAVYVSASSGSRDTASQEADLLRWSNEGHPLKVRWYRDTCSGTTRGRPGWSKLMQAVRKGTIWTIAVWRLDCLGRTATGLTELFEDLRERQVNLVSLRDGLDLSTPTGRLMADAVAFVATCEIEVRAERIAADQVAARERGARVGRPEGPGKRLKVTREQEETIRRLKAEGKKIAAIARAVSLSRPTIYSVLDRPAN
ncbi:MAG: recombinase family protein [Planctomycetaceae bacterium]|nr:recombinase family protein [Planctomycetaceae bacterium]MBV8608462.1 recombinase family protein [Singulisphaera sp.]